MTIGQALRALRDRKGLTMPRVAGLAEISISVVHGAENDKDITAKTLRRIVTKGLGARMSSFWREIEETDDEEADVNDARSTRGRKTRKAAA